MILFYIRKKQNDMFVVIMFLVKLYYIVFIKVSKYIYIFQVIIKMNYPIEFPTTNIYPKHKITQYINILQINNLHSNFVRSLLILTDNRIATSGGKSISICSLNPFSKQLDTRY